MRLVLPRQGEATRVVLVRHAEPDESARGRCYGSFDVPLSAKGRRRAEALAEALAPLPLAAVYSSPLQRALETALPIAAAHGLEPLLHDGLRELDFGELEGEPFEKIARKRPQLFQAWMETPTAVSFPGGEALSDLRTRALAASDEIRRSHARSSVAIVAHGGVTRLILAAALAMPDDALFRLEQGYGAVSVVDWVGQAPLVRAVNVA